jgi:ATP-dependent Clp protease ATP-binding subunit ClpB
MESVFTSGSSARTPAVVAVANAVRRSRAAVCRIPNRPIGIVHVLGPTGVGKTELARALAEFLFDDETHMVRIDMSEYMEKHSVSRLIGAPPGYVGYDEGGQLTEAVRRRPYSVVLFDEIEKAHRDVFNVLLQILDDGRLTDGQGRTVDFKNTVILMTSNVGSHRLLGVQPDIEAAMDELRHTFRPEFLNRVDEIVVFERLTREDIDQIVDLQIERFRKLLKERDLGIELLPEARTFLAEKGYDPTYGARPLKRAIMTYLQNPLAKQIITGSFLPGDTIVVDRKGAELEFRRKLKEAVSGV